MTSQPFFIVGLGRSGTTLLRLMLNSHPRLAIPYESHFLPHYFERLTEFGDLTLPDNVRRLVSDILAEDNIGRWDHSFDHERVFGSVKEHSLAGVIDAVYREYAAAKGKDRWGDKSSYMDEIAVINQIFDRAYFIHIIRDGRDVAMSVLKQPWGPNDIIGAAEWWNDHVWVTRRMGAILGSSRYLEVRFEDLVRDTEKELQRVCSFLGEAYDPKMLTYYSESDDFVPENTKSLHYNVDRPPLTARAEAWRHTMSPYDVALFGKYGGRMLKEMEYQTPRPSTSRAGMAWHVVKLGLGRLARKLRPSSIRPGSR